ncbi:MAG: PfkB family carbohydrate kinase [Paludibacteraceae bacterium]|nr:PfkB family carbohydrate kinase [Paludibacteraceae bacterium]
MTTDKQLSIMGVGAYCLDTIVKREYPNGFVPGRRNKFVEHLIQEEVGSNPGNVMCIMGWFGWNSYPIALFDNSREGLKLTADFQRYGCNTRFVSNTPEGGTNLLKVIHALDDNGNPIRKFSKRHAPNSGFPKDKAFTVMGKDATLPKFIASLDFLPDVYFFESTTAAWRELGKWMRSKGVMVYYEVQRMSMKEFPKYLKCMKESDIVKFSDEAVEDLGFVDELKDKLVIQTLGSKGVRFNLRGAGWQALPPVVNENVVDTEGCGDWTTASFINALGKRGVLKFENLTADLVSECLMEAQGYASQCASYIGTKGIIAAENS